MLKMPFVPLGRSQLLQNLANDLNNPGRAAALQRRRHDVVVAEDRVAFGRVMVGDDSAPALPLHRLLTVTNETSETVLVSVV